jgi:hypothetical protein
MTALLIGASDIEFLGKPYLKSPGSTILQRIFSHALLQSYAHLLILNTWK